MDDIAIAHEELTTHGGAERVAFCVARTFNAPIYALRVDDEIVPDDVDAIEIECGRVGERLLDSHPLVRDGYQMLRWQHVEQLYNYDTIIQTKNNPGWLVPRADQTVVRYCHSPPRMQNDRWHRRDVGIVAAGFNTAKRLLYGQTVKYPDCWIANSELVQRRMECYWGVDTDEITVCYPPVDCEAFGPDVAPTEDFHLVLGRLQGHKRVPEIIHAYDAPGMPKLLIAGDGRDSADVDRAAAGVSNVKLLGYVPEKQKRRLYARAEALVFNAIQEDFGLVPIEAMASGTPVIGVRDGFTEHQIQHELNGRSYRRGVHNLRACVREFTEDGVEWSESEIAEFAQRFAAERFREEMRKLVRTAEQEAAVQPEWEDEVEHGQKAVQSIRADGGGS